MATNQSLNGRSALDATNLRLIAELQEDARLSLAELGRRVGLSSPAVADRLARLEETGVIRAYRAEIDPEVLGRGVLSLVSVLSTDSIDAAATEAGMAAIEQVETAYNVAGEDSYMLVVRTHSIAELSEVLQRLQAVDGVARTRTSVVLATPVRRGPVV
jgi:Lrp/AsnC family transcriptional regulator, leucine-responsive regulatory protein